MKRKRPYIDYIYDRIYKITPKWKRRKCGAIKIFLRSLKRKKHEVDYIYDSITKLNPHRKKRRIMTQNEECKIVKRYHCYLHNNDISVCQIYDCMGIDYDQYVKMRTYETTYTYII